MCRFSLPLWTYRLRNVSDYAVWFCFKAHIWRGNHETLGNHKDHRLPNHQMKTWNNQLVLDRIIPFNLNFDERAYSPNFSYPGPACMLIRYNSVANPCTWVQVMDPLRINSEYLQSCSSIHFAVSLLGDRRKEMDISLNSLFIVACYYVAFSYR